MADETMDFEVRQAGPGDETALARLLGVLGYPAVLEQVKERCGVCSGPFSRVYVAVLEQGVAGFLSFHAIPLFHEPGMLGRITAMAIDPAFQRQGVGRTLVAAAEAFAASCGCERMEVTSSDRREKDAHVFYRALGYESDCRRFLKRLTGVSALPSSAA